MGQVAKAVTMYVQDYDERFPLSGPFTDTGLSLSHPFSLSSSQGGENVVFYDGHVKWYKCFGPQWCEIHRLLKNLPDVEESP